MSREPELAFLEAWDRELSKFFSQLEAAEQSDGADSATLDPAQSVAYRKRVGQDLKSFHQKLSQIMERDQSGQ